MPRNVEMVQKGISILHPRLAEYVCLEILHTYGDDAWWQEVKSALSDQLADLRPGGGYGECGCRRRDRHSNRPGECP